MSRLLRQASEGGLAACAVVFTVSAFTAAICSLIVFGILKLLFTVPTLYSTLGAACVWLLCMATTWRHFARARASWPSPRTSTGLLHTFQFLSLGICFSLAYLLGDADSSALPRFAFAIEAIISLFFLSYVFLGWTLRCPFPRSAYLGLALALASTFWSYAHLPKL